VPYARNARVHSAEQIGQLAASICKWGWTMPVLADEAGMIIAGHGRVLAAQKLGMAEVPVMVAAGWSEEQKRAYVLADNKLALNAGWDPELLRAELTSLEGSDFGPGLIGFSAAELSDLFGGSAPADGGGRGSNNASLAERFGIAPFSVLNAREGWWQERKRAWLALGIRSELGRGAPIGGSPMPLDRVANATPGGAPMPAADYSKNHSRGDGRGRAVRNGTLGANPPNERAILKRTGRYAP
jgi:hypothetical protein